MERRQRAQAASLVCKEQVARRGGSHRGFCGLCRPDRRIGLTGRDPPPPSATAMLLTGAWASKPACCAALGWQHVHLAFMSRHQTRMATPLKTYGALLILLALGVAACGIYRETVILRLAYENTLFCGEIYCQQTAGAPLPLAFPSVLTFDALLPLRAENRPFYVSCMNLLMHMDLAAFSDTEAKAFGPPPGARLLLRIDRPGQPFRAVAVATGNRIVVALRGITDLSEDLQVGQVPLSPQMPQVLVHRGYQEEYADLAEQVLGPLVAAQPAALSFMGHSLGGALAVLLGAEAARRLPEAQVAAVTYGTPRIGNAAFVDSTLGMSHVRIENEADIVPSLPPSVTPNARHPHRPWMYYHSGRAVRFEKNWLSIVNNHSLSCYRAWVQEAA